MIKTALTKKELNEKFSKEEQIELVKQGILTIHYLSNNEIKFFQRNFAAVNKVYPHKEDDKVIKIHYNVTAAAGIRDFVNYWNAPSEEEATKMIELLEVETDENGAVI